MAQASSDPVVAAWTAVEAAARQYGIDVAFFGKSKTPSARTRIRSSRMRLAYAKKRYESAQRAHRTMEVSA